LDGQHAATTGEDAAARGLPSSTRDAGFAASATAAAGFKTAATNAANATCAGNATRTARTALRRVSRDRG
jgi:hypothetical protein